LRHREIHLRGITDGRRAADDPGAGIDQRRLESELLERRLLAPLQRTPWRSPRHPWLLAAGVLLMLLLLMAQALYLWRSKPPVNRLLATFCEAAGCTAPLLRRPDLIALTNRLFSRVEGVDGYYRLQLGVINKATHRQPFPVIEASLSDARGEIQARARFQPHDYLHAPMNNSLMTPNEEYRFTFVVQGSVADARGFMLDFF
jgi:hypothetical protein